MFCYQCEQTAKGSGCVQWGVCGKSPETASLQDVLLYGLRGIAMYANRAWKLAKKNDREVNVFTVEGLFTTVTNVNFDPERLRQILSHLIRIRERAKKIYEEACREVNEISGQLSGPAGFIPADNIPELVRQGEALAIVNRMNTQGPDITGLQELVTYGLKGMAAYADHAQVLGVEDDEVYAFFHEALDFLNTEIPTLDELVTMAMRVGEVNLKVMELLSTANTTAYGTPQPTPVRVTPVKGKSILISGHDLKDLEELLKQTEGKNINVYTHGEMLPAHGYPGLKKYKHLVGNYGSAWQNQHKEFDEFPGAILMTTNCIQKPKDSYIHRIFTSGLVAWPSVTHISDRDFTPVIEAALKEKGFEEDAPEKTILTGFGHDAVLGVADKVIDAVKAGQIRHFFLVGGCDGIKTDRHYYTEFVGKLPKDTVVLTLACGKYRFNQQDLGDIGGIPRLLDVGQCNDAYSAIRIAGALAQAFSVGVNELPLTLVLSWYEQKAVAILLTLFSLGIKNIRIGPSLPAFVTAPVLKVLIEKFNIQLITKPEDDIKAILGEKISA